MSINIWVRWSARHRRRIPGNGEGNAPSEERSPWPQPMYSATAAEVDSDAATDGTRKPLDGGRSRATPAGRRVLPPPIPPRQLSERGDAGGT
jgi:hypothetical protein